MSGADRRVLEMVEQKRITAAEGDALLAAMRAGKRSPLRALVDPYDRIPTGAMLAIGAVAAAVSVGAAVTLGLRFDGFLDIHAPTGPVTAPRAIGDQLVAWPLSALALWLVALAFGARGRLVDFLAALGVARVIALVGGALVAALAPPPDAMTELARSAVASPSEALGNFVQVLPMAGAALVTAGWFVAAAVFAFRHASGLRGGRLAGAFVAALVVAEVLSKLALWAVSVVL